MNLKLLEDHIPGNRKMLIGSAIIGVILIIALFAPLLAPHNPEAIDLRNRISPGHPNILLEPITWADVS